jgi:WD40 repeat protein
MRRTLALVWLVALLALLPSGPAAVSQAEAEPAEPSSLASTSTNSKIAFASDRDGNYEIYVMNAGGSGQVNLTNSPASDEGPSWSPDGSKIAFNSDRDGNFEIYLMNADGSGVTRLTNSPAGDRWPSWSPDGSEIAFTSERDGNFEIYVMNEDGSGQINLSTNPASDLRSVWSPDGSEIAFTSVRDGNAEIYVMNADGTGQTDLTQSPAPDFDAAWSPSPKIAFASTRDDDSGEIYVMSPDGSAQTRLTNNPTVDGSPAWSPDASEIAFMSDRDGDTEIYVMNADGSAQTRLTNNSASDGEPDWQAGPPPCPATCSQAPSGLNTCDLEVGDILLSHHFDGLYALENVPFSGYWTHAGIYDGCGMITESSGSIDCDSWWKVWTCLSDEPGVEVKPIEDSGFGSAPDWAILRTKSDGGKRDAAVAYAEAQEGKKYNWNYPDKWTTDKFYCSQLVWRAYEEQGIDLDSDRGALNALVKWMGPWGVADAVGVAAAVPPDDIYFDGDLTLVKQRPGIGAALRRAVLRILSPAHLYVTDPEGRHTGVDPNTGQVVEEIPGVFYSGPNVEPEFLSIQDMAGTWETEVIGAGEGSYTLQLENLDAENHGLTEVIGDAQEGSVTTYEATHLAAGWNTKCYAGEQKPVEDALAEVIDSVVAVYRLEPNQTFARWFPSRPELSTISAVNPYDQLFILTSASAGWVQELADARQTEIDLVQGWNSICYAGASGPVSDALSGLSGDVAVLYRLGEDQAWARYVPDRPDLSDITQMNQLDALLLLVTQPGGVHWTFEPSAATVASSVFIGPGVSLDLHDPEVDGLTVTEGGSLESSVFDIARIVWDWGDGVVEEGWFPGRHSYAQPGRYTLTVRVFDADGVEIAGQSSSIHVGGDGGGKDMR